MAATVLLFLHIPVAYGCWGGGGDYYNYGAYNYPAATTTTEKPYDKHDPVDRNKASAWGGFKLPASLEAKWRKWLEDYNNERKKLEEDGDSKYLKERGPGSGWPPSWQGLNGGDPGADPPPWAYVPINKGLPSFCYDPPKAGNCKKQLKRWAFNPYIEQCTEFDYTGCGENQNNFKEQIKCEEACMKMPISGCDPKTQMYIEDD